MNNILIKIYETPLFFLHGGTRMFSVRITRITRMFFFYTDVFITNTDFLFHEHGTSRKARKGSFYTDVFLTNTDATRSCTEFFLYELHELQESLFLHGWLFLTNTDFLFHEHGCYTEGTRNFFCTNNTNHTNLFFYPTSLF